MHLPFCRKSRFINIFFNKTLCSHNERSDYLANSNKHYMILCKNFEKNLFIVPLKITVIP